MKKLILLMIFFLMYPYSLRAEKPFGADQDFMKDLDNVKSPFEDGLPKPVPVVIPAEPKPAEFKPKAIPQGYPALVTIPALHLKGVVVGEDIHEAIINDRVV